MENKINIAELLKDCPKGMELDCALFENLEFDHINKNNGTYPIICRVKTEYGHYNPHTFTEYGCYSAEKYAKCAIFPKGKNTWEGFQRPFKDGEIIATDLGSVFILKSCPEDEIHYHSYVGVTCCNEIREQQIPFAYKHVCHLATEEEKAKLFQAIIANNYKWNPKTKTLEKLPKFKVGDRITNGKVSITIGYIDDEYYYEIGRNIASRVFIKNQDGWSLIPNKFDINTLVPFESKVLVRGSDPLSEWKPAIFGVYKENKRNGFYVVGGNCWNKCIPYEGNEHLIGTTNDCDDYFKTWK